MQGTDCAFAFNFSPQRSRLMFAWTFNFGVGGQLLRSIFESVTLKIKTKLSNKAIFFLFPSNFGFCTLILFSKMTSFYNLLRKVCYPIPIKKTNQPQIALYDGRDLAWNYVIWQVSKICIVISQQKTFFYLFSPQKTRDPEANANDFIDIYLDQIARTDDKSSSFYGEKGLKSLEVVLVDLFLGGSETTATSINWTVLYLLHYPEVQAKIHAELDQIVGTSR